MADCAVLGKCPIQEMQRSEGKNKCSMVVLLAVVAKMQFARVLCFTGSGDLTKAVFSTSVESQLFSSTLELWANFGEHSRQFISTSGVSECGSLRGMAPDGAA